MISFTIVTFTSFDSFSGTNDDIRAKFNIPNVGWTEYMLLFEKALQGGSDAKTI